jgi:hypothetical protein
MGFTERSNPVPEGYVSSDPEQGVPEVPLFPQEKGIFEIGHLQSEESKSGGYNN